VILTGDALDVLKTLPAESVQTCVTSPPYWGLRDYGVSGQLGLEKTPDEYVAQMVQVFREVRRVLRKDGTLWLNLGDTYGANYRWGGDRAFSEKQKSNRGSDPTMRRNAVPSKQLVGIPWRVAFALQADGWYLRQDIIWHKPNPMPESVRDRCTKAHEYIFLLAKSERYLFDVDAIKEPAVCGAKGSQFHTGKTGEHQLGRAQKVRPSAAKGSFKAKGEPLPGQLPFRAIREMRNKRSVWTCSTKPFKGAHFATFPPDLIEPCILAGSRFGDTVLDPFFGAGTTGLVAQKHGRKYLGIELNPDYAKIAEQRIANWKPAKSKAERLSPEDLDARNQLSFNFEEGA
jgi:DNA modification methylase